MSSHLDYCNSLLSGIVDTDLTKLQCVQNRLARIVMHSPPFTHSVPLFRSLHWLPVKFRIVFKITLLTCKTSWKTACLSPCNAYPITPILFTEIKQRNHSVALGPRPMQVQEHFNIAPLVCETASHCLSVQPLQL